MPGKILARIKDALDRNDDGKVNFLDLAMLVNDLRSKDMTWTDSGSINKLQDNLWHLAGKVTEANKLEARNSLEKVAVLLGTSVTEKVINNVTNGAITVDNSVIETVVDTVVDEVVETVVETVVNKVKKGKK